MLLRFLKFVLPNPHHPPACRVVASPLYAARPPQGAARHVAAMPLYVVHHPVAGFVALDFTPPPCRAVRRPRRVLGTAMPETAVHKHGQSCLSKYEIHVHP